MTCDTSSIQDKTLEENTDTYEVSKQLVQETHSTSMEHWSLIDQPCDGESTYQVCRPAMIVCGTRISDHAHIVSKWCPTMTLATECVEMSAFDYSQAG